MKNKIQKVLYASFDRVPQPKGASAHISQFVRALSGRYDVTLLTPAPQASDGEFSGARHIEVEVCGGNFLEETELFRRAVDDHVKNEEYDAIHFRGIWEGIPIVRRKSEKKYAAIFEVNGLPSIELQYHFPAVARNAEFMETLRNMEMETLVDSDAIIVPSGVTRNYLISRGVAAWKISVIPNGVDVDLFTPTEIPAPSPPVIIYVGTLAPWQGVAQLIEAFKGVLKVADARLRIVSKARKDWLKSLQKRANKLKIGEAVDFSDPVRHRDMPDILRDAHIGAAPFPATERNTRQGFCPIKVLEYMASGLAIAASEIEPVKELVEHERDALLYKPNSSARLRDTLIRLVEEPELRKELSASARRRAIDFFTWNNGREKLLNLYSNPALFNPKN